MDKLNSAWLICVLEEEKEEKEEEEEEKEKEKEEEEEEEEEEGKGHRNLGYQRRKKIGSYSSYLKGKIRREKRKQCKRIYKELNTNQAGTY